MRVRLGDDGDWYPFDGGRLLVREARELEELTGMGLQDFADGINRGKINALVFMLYISQKRAGVAVRWRDFDEADVGDLQIDDEGEAEAAAKAEADAAAAAERGAAGDPPPVGPAPAGGLPDGAPVVTDPEVETPRAEALAEVAAARNGDGRRRKPPKVRTG